MPSADEKPGILPLAIRKFVDSRRQTKQPMADKNLSVDLRMQVSSFYVKTVYSLEWHLILKI